MVIRVRPVIIVDHGCACRVTGIVALTILVIDVNGIGFVCWIGSDAIWSGSWARRIDDRITHNRWLLLLNHDFAVSFLTGVTPIIAVGCDFRVASRDGRCTDHTDKKKRPERIVAVHGIRVSNESNTLKHLRRLQHHQWCCEMLNAKTTNRIPSEIVLFG
jgi:hypothetical protein